MRETISCSVDDLDRLVARLAHVDLSGRDRIVLNDLIRIGREIVEARAAARAAGLIVGAAPIPGELSTVREMFRDAFAPGSRANVGRVLP